MGRRIGIIFPDDGETELDRLETWLRDRGAPDVAVDIVRSPSDGVHEPAALERTGDVEVLRTAAAGLRGNCSAAVWACTSGSFIGGLAGARRQATAMTEALGAPVSSTSLALGHAARRLGRSVEVLSPYPPDIGARFVAFLGELGVAVSAISDLGAPSGQDSRRLDITAEVERHESRHGRTGAPLLIPDTAVDTLDLVADLEQAFGRAVITANQASVWEVLRLAGCPARLERAGCLFRCDPPGNRSR